MKVTHVGVIENERGSVRVHVSRLVSVFMRSPTAVIKSIASNISGWEAGARASSGRLTQRARTDQVRLVKTIPNSLVLIWNKVSR